MNKKEKVLKEFLEDLHPLLCLSMYRYLHDLKNLKQCVLEITRDMIQEIYLKVWEDKIEFTDKNQATIYLYDAVEKKSIEYLKIKKLFAGEGESTELTEEEINQATDYFESGKSTTIQNKDIIERALNCLPPEVANKMRMGIEDYDSNK